MPYYDRKPGYVRDEIRQALKRLTDREYLGKLCTHTAKGHAKCRGWNRRAWANYEAWRKLQGGSHATA